MNEVRPPAVSAVAVGLMYSAGGIRIIQTTNATVSLEVVDQPSR